MPTKRKPEPGDVNFQWGVDDPNTVDRLLAEAHGSLDSADQLAQETGSARLAKLPASLAALRQPYDERGPVRKFTEPLAEVGNKAMLAAIPAGINPAIGGALLTGGGLATLPDYLRKLIAPEGDESRPGVVDTGMAGLAMLPSTGALRGLRGLARGAEEAANPLADLVGGRALAFEGPQVAGRSRPAIDKLMATESFSKLPKGPVSRVPGGPEQGAQSFADAVRTEAARTKSPFEQMSAAGEFAGDRTNRGVGALEQGGPQGLTALHEGRIQPYVNEVPLEIPSVKPLDPMERLAARSKERFGKKYRKE